MAERRPVITLMTDFGEADYYVAAMKGAILTVNPQAEIVDLTHQVPPHDLYTAAFTLLCCYADFPKMTLHVVVVDPGVGTDRRPLLVMTDNYNFIGPDNGVFSYIYQREHVYRIIHLNETHYFRQPVSNTFHGRDVFAPSAGYVSRMVDWSKMGAEINDPVRFNTPTAVVVALVCGAGASSVCVDIRKCVEKSVWEVLQGADAVAARFEPVAPQSPSSLSSLIAAWT